MQDLILTIAVLSIFFVIFYYIDQVDKEEWNDGKCPHCKEGTWKFSEEKQHYICSNCKRTLFKF